MRIKLKQWAEENALSYQSAVKHFHKGLIDGSFKDPVTGSIYVTITPTIEKQDRGVALYSRVSSSQNKDNLERQSERLVNYAIARGYRITHNVSEIASGMNDSRPKLSKLLEQEWDILVVEHKDRLTRFGFPYLEKIAQLKNARIEVINVPEDKDDLMNDLVAVITSFCARLYGQRRSKRLTEKITQDLQDENKNH
jgi:putative resolvase